MSAIPCSVSPSPASSPRRRTAVFRPEKEKSQPGLPTIGRGSSTAEASPEAPAEALPEALPEGDVLIHCGDFAPGPIWPNGEAVRTDEAQARFDAWLAAQPHPLKVVVRGNHDPRHALFPRSGAVYATSPRALELEVRGRPLRLALVPFERQPRGKNAGARKKRAKAGLGGGFVGGRDGGDGGGVMHTGLQNYVEDKPLGHECVRHPIL